MDVSDRVSVHQLFAETSFRNRTATVIAKRRLESRGRKKEGKITLDHVVLEVVDPARSVEFYRRILGLRPVRLAEFRRGRAPFPSGRVGPGTVLGVADHGRFHAEISGWQAYA